MNNTLITVDAGSLDALTQSVSIIANRMERMETVLGKWQSFAHLPDWLTSRQAYEVLPFSNDRTLAKWVRRGIIRAKVIGDNGGRRAYNKRDCLEFALNAENWHLAN